MIANDDREYPRIKAIEYSQHDMTKRVEYHETCPTSYTVVYKLYQLPAENE